MDCAVRQPHHALPRRPRVDRFDGDAGMQTCTPLVASASLSASAQILVEAAQRQLLAHHQVHLRAEAAKMPANSTAM